ncbi:MAG: hypothetical protein HY976_01905 [Candidatus Kerfeldbacteria bacterium]|nr:hypothetical protein [Candidatus Kerfeldbacteria bacterium]
MDQQPEIPEVVPIVTRRPMPALLRQVFSNNVGPYAYRPAGVLLALLGLLTIFQITLIGGAPLGQAAWGGGHEVLPLNFRLGSAFSIAIYGLVIWLVRRRLEFPSRRGYRLAVKIVAGYFALGVLMNLASASLWERYLMAPVALALAWACWTIARARTERDPDVHINS